MKIITSIKHQHRKLILKTVSIEDIQISCLDNSTHNNPSKITFDFNVKYEKTQEHKECENPKIVLKMNKFNQKEELVSL